MKAETKRKFANGVARATSSILGDVHLGLQSMADGVSNLEGSIVNKLTGVNKESVVQARRWKTQQRQDKIKSDIEQMRANLMQAMSNRDHQDTMDLTNNL